MGGDEVGGERADELDFQAWVAPFLPAMTRYASRLVSASDRDDVVQESLVRAWSRWSTFDPERGHATAWLLGIVRDRSRRHRTRTRQHEDAADQTHPPTWLTPADIDLERAMATLTERQRSAVDLYYFVDLDVDTISRLLGCAPGTVKATLSQARDRLRATLEDRDG